MKYRREIDGLRAVAVIPVVLFHAGVPYFSGGFVGVDIFLVISGYLVTSILLSEIETGRFSLLHFYERRLRRLLPAMLVVALACLPAAWLLLTVDELQKFARSAIAAIFFTSNYFFKEAGEYFTSSSEVQPLLHTWSLAVEVQYYSVAPLLLLLISRLNERRRMQVLLIVLLASLLAAQIWVLGHQKTVFYTLPFRLWEFSLGGILAMIKPQVLLQNMTPVMRDLSAATGLAMIAVSVLVLDHSVPYPSFLGLGPTFGAALIIAFATQDSRTGRLLASRPLVGIGLLSYSVYLWHQPLFAFARLSLDGLDTLQVCILLAALVPLSYASWLWVELPTRRMKLSLTWGSAFLPLAAAAVIIATICAFSSITNGFLLGQERRIAAELKNNPAAMIGNLDERKFVMERIAMEDMRPDVLVVGSSRLMQLGRVELGMKTLNLSVSGASLEDILAIVSEATAKFSPRMLVISADPWLYNAQSGQNRWLAIAASYDGALGKMEISAAPRARPDAKAPGELATIVTQFYARTSLVDYAAQTPDALMYRQKILRDGTRIYDRAYSTKGEREKTAEFDTLLNYAMKRYTYSPELMNVFSNFLKRYSRDYRIVLVLSPYDPHLYARIRDKKPIFMEIEKQFREIAQAQGVEIVGSYDPAVANCSEAEFFDGMHPRNTCMRSVIVPLVNPAQ